MAPRKRAISSAPAVSEPQAPRARRRAAAKALPAKTISAARGGTHLGELGVEHEAVDVTFTFFGQVIRVHPELSEFVMVEFMDQASSIEEDDPRAITMVKDFIREIVHPDDFELFWVIARKKRQNSVDLQRLVRTVIEWLADRPTGPPSASAAGRSTTDENSKDASYERAMQANTGRPDRQLAIVQAHSVHRGA